MFLIIISWDLYHKENNLTLFQAIHLKEIQDCVEAHWQRSVRTLRFHYLHLQLLKRVKSKYGVSISIWLESCFDWIWIWTSCWSDYRAGYECRESGFVNEDLRNEETAEGIDLITWIDVFQGYSYVPFSTFFFSCWVYNVVCFYRFSFSFWCTLDWLALMYCMLKEQWLYWFFFFR